MIYFTWYGMNYTISLYGMDYTFHLFNCARARTYRSIYVNVCVSVRVQSYIYIYFRLATRPVTEPSSGYILSSLTRKSEAPLLRLLDRTYIYIYYKYIFLRMRHSRLLWFQVFLSLCLLSAYMFFILFWCFSFLSSVQKAPVFFFVFHLSLLISVIYSHMRHPF